MAGIAKIQRQQAPDDMGKLLTLGGAAVGGFFGGPQGAMTGANAGGMINGIVAAPPKPEGPAPIGAMGRRMAEIDNSPSQVLASSLQAVKQISDPAMRADLARPLLAADYLAKNRQA
jgi:hypothetical protein